MSDLCKMMLTSPNAPNGNHSELGIRYWQLPLRGARRAKYLCVPASGAV